DLNVQEQQVRIDVINEGKKGIFGFMKQDARIELTIIDPELKEFNSIEDLRNRNQQNEQQTQDLDEDTESNNITEDNSNHSQNEKKNALNDIADQTLEYILNIIKEMNINVEGSYKIKS